MKLPLELSLIIDADDPVCTFSEVMNHIDLRRFFAEKGCEMGRPRCDAVKMLKVILFAFMEGGYETLRELAKHCRTDIRYMWLLDGMKAPSHMTFSNFIRNELSGSIEEIFREINTYIFNKEGVDLNHVYIDGTKIEANANRYTWVWKKSCLKSRNNVFSKVSRLFEKVNAEILVYYGLSLETRTEYSVEYIEEMQNRFCEITGTNPENFVHGSGRHKSPEQRAYEELSGYLSKLKDYSEKIKICGDERNSFSKTDHDASFMRIKRDYMKNDQLLPAYNMQIAVCDEYVATVHAMQYASDMDCFIPLMEKFKTLYGHYPQYAVADAGYGSYNNYLFCEEHEIEKFMKFTMYEKTVKDKDYREDPFRAVNFQRNEQGQLVCPNGRIFHYLKEKLIRGNKYGRTEEYYACEDCSGCPYKAKCYKSEKGPRVIRINSELTSFHQEVLENLQSVQGALLRMNRSIQAEGVFGSIKWNRTYHRAFRRGINSVSLEFTLIACGFNLYKYHNKKMNAQRAAS